MLNIVNVVIWTIVGILCFAMDEVPKIMYGITWGCLMLNLIGNCIV